MRTTVWIIAAALCLAIVSCRPGEIVEFPEDKQLTVEEIKVALKGSDFRQKNAARKQLEKLVPAERVSLLEALLKEGDSPTRLMAVAELMNLPEETYKPILRKVAADDPDEEIREFASVALDEEEPEEEEAPEAPEVPEAPDAPEAPEAPPE